jgi:hypothetical protein
LSKSVIVTQSGNYLNISATGEASIVGSVGVNSLPSLPAGTNNIGGVNITNDISNDGWITLGKGDNVVALASKVGEAGKSHYITSVFATYTASLTSKGTLTIKDGTTIISEVDLESSRDVTFGKPIKITSGNSVSADLSASGTAGVIGKINLTGFTI